MGPIQREGETDPTVVKMTTFANCGNCCNTDRLGINKNSTTALKV